MNTDKVECIHSLYASIQEIHGNIKLIKLSMTLEEFIDRYASNGIRFSYDRNAGVRNADSDRS